MALPPLETLNALPAGARAVAIHEVGMATCHAMNIEESQQRTTSRQAMNRYIEESQQCATSREAISRSYGFLPVLDLALSIAAGVKSAVTPWTPLCESLSLPAKALSPL